LRAAFSYFTILPAGTTAAPDADALAWLPLVGAVVGALAGGAAYAVALIAPHGLAVATAFGLTIILTGAIHLDGFLDCCDALFASAPPARRLEILKDPHHGTFALAGFAVAGVAWLAALGVLAPASYPLALAVSGAAARWSSVIHARWSPYARADAPPALAQRPPMRVLAPSGGILLSLAAALGAPKHAAGLAAALAALVAAAAALAFARARLGGGLVGDAYGFAIVVAEVAALIVLAIFP